MVQRINAHRVTSATRLNHRSGSGKQRGHCRGNAWGTVAVVLPTVIPPEQMMSGSPLNSGGSTTSLACYIPGPAAAPQYRCDDVRVELAEWRRQTGRSLKARATCFQVKSSTSLLDQRQRPTASRSPAGRAPRRSLGRCLGQAVTGGSLVWRRRRLRGVLSVVVVDPGLRPRFFSVLPTPANFRSR
jgi:hypothetical protein